MTSTQDLNQSLEWFAQVQKTLRPISTIKFEGTSISLEQFNLLHAIETQKEEFTPTRFAADIGVSKSMISGQISRLLKADLIESLTSPVDRRQHNLNLTPQGLSIYTATKEQVAKQLDKVHADIQALG